MKYLREVSRLKIESSRKETFPILVALALVSKNISIWESSMIPSPVFSVWTSTSFLKDPEVELVSEEDAKAELELNTESAKMKPWNGSRKSMMEPSITDQFDELFKFWI